MELDHRLPLFLRGRVPLSPMSRLDLRCRRPGAAVVPTLSFPHQGVDCNNINDAVDPHSVVWLEPTLLSKVGQTTPPDLMNHRLIMVFTLFSSPPKVPLYLTVSSTSFTPTAHCFRDYPTDFVTHRSADLFALM